MLPRPVQHETALACQHISTKITRIAENVWEMLRLHMVSGHSSWSVRKSFTQSAVVLVLLKIFPHKLWQFRRVLKCLAWGIKNFVETFISYAFLTCALRSYTLLRIQNHIGHMDSWKCLGSVGILHGSLCDEPLCEKTCHRGCSSVFGLPDLSSQAEADHLGLEKYNL